MDGLLAGIGEKLLPCPICNGRAKRTMGKNGGYIECVECGLRTRDCRKNDNEPIDNRWNKRHAPANIGTAGHQPTNKGQNHEVG